MKPTTRNIRSLPDGLHCLERGVYLRVRDGRRNWILRYRFDGARKELALGPASALSIPAVQAKVAAVRALIAEGKDPRVVRREKKAIRQGRLPDASAGENVCPTFADLIEPTLEHVSYMRQFTGAYTLKSWRTSLRKLAKSFGCKRLDAITRDDVVAAVRPMWTTHPRTARDLRSRAAGLFDYAKTLGYIESNPAEWKGNLDALLPSLSTVRRSVPEKHHAALSSEDLRTLAKKLAASDLPVDKAILFGILTVGRCSEWRCAQWDEIDAEARTFSVPQSRRKDKRPEPFVVSLSRQAMEILKHMPVTPGCPYVFEGEAEGRPYSRSYLWRRLAMLSEKPATLHGTRSTFSDWCANNDKNFLVSEKCLMHAVGGKVFMAYQRDDLLDKRRQLLQEWADFLLG